ncbi:MAG TPA: glycosyltransferase [Thermoanaerobaculia bacterium]
MNPPEPRRVLIATHQALSSSGSDLYTRDLALALLRRGWQPSVYATALGAVAEELRQATIPVTNDISAIAVAPHVIHGHHHLETLTALARFPGVPALFVCHDGLTWHSTPPRTRRIGQYIAVDRNCRDRMMLEHGIPESAVRILPNAVDLERFRRRPPLPRRPLRALVFSNVATQNLFASTIEAACKQRGIILDIVGSAAGTATDHPEEILSRYDLVFGKARCALEAAASGTAVIVCDAGGLAGMITTRDLDAMRQLNFGLRLLRRPITEAAIGAEIDRYDTDDAAKVTDAVRATAGIDLLAEQFIELYEELQAGHVPMTPEDELRATAESLSRLSKDVQLARPVVMSPTERLLRRLYRLMKR